MEFVYKRTDGILMTDKFKDMLTERINSIVGYPVHVGIKSYKCYYNEAAKHFVQGNKVSDLLPDYRFKLHGLGGLYHEKAFSANQYGYVNQVAAKLVQDQKRLQEYKHRYYEAEIVKEKLRMMYANQEDYYQVDQELIIRRDLYLQLIKRDLPVGSILTVWYEGFEDGLTLYAQRVLECLKNHHFLHYTAILDKDIRNKFLNQNKNISHINLGLEFQNIWKVEYIAGSHISTLYERVVEE